MSFISLLSPCAWLVKWHNCKCWNDSVSDITEKFSLFCNFSASRSITTPAVIFGLLSLLLLLNCDITDLLLLKYWTAELLNIVNKLNKSVMKQSTCGAVFCQPGGDELKHDNTVINCQLVMKNNKNDSKFYEEWDTIFLLDTDILIYRRSWNASCNIHLTMHDCYLAKVPILCHVLPIRVFRNSFLSGKCS